MTDFIKLDSIIPKKDNPRYIKEEKMEKLIDSIIFFPKMMKARPMVIDENDILLGGNMRDKALLLISERIKSNKLTVKQKKAIEENPLFDKLDQGFIPSFWVTKFDDFTDKEKEQFVIKDNVGFGEWDMDSIANNWDLEELEDWGFDLPDYLSDVEGEDSFSLADGDKAPFQQITFTLADDQAEYIKNAMSEAKKQEEYKYIETYGNENSNGNALYYLITQALKTPF